MRQTHDDEQEHHGEDDLGDQTSRPSAPGAGNGRNSWPSAIGIGRTPWRAASWPELP
jgi:hypothetical protein